MVGSTEKCVIDASFVLAHLLGEGDPLVESTILDYVGGSVSLIAPEIINYEVGNALSSALSRKRVSLSQCKELYSDFLDLSVEIVQVEYIMTQEVSLKEKLSFYDAAYLALSKKLGLKLLTLDRRLRDL
jgi:predicted nucleic acid-binding protein